MALMKIDFPNPDPAVRHGLTPRRTGLIAYLPRYGPVRGTNCAGCST